jgi:hypothetical protein
MREFPNKAVFVGEGDYGLGRAVAQTEICGELRCADTVGHSGRLYCAANNTDPRDAGIPERTGARFQASLWLGIAADIRRRSTVI